MSLCGANFEGIALGGAGQSRIMRNLAGSGLSLPAKERRQECLRYQNRGTLIF
jgi:hypothetical protein